MWDQSCSTRLNIKNFVVGPRNVFVHFSSFLLYIAFVCLHSTNRLVILLEKHYVLCKVQGQSWDILYISQVFARSVMGKMTSRQIFLRELQFSSVTVIPPMLHINLHLNNNLIRKRSRRCLETSTLSKIWWRWAQKDFHILLYKALTDRCLLQTLFHFLSRLQTYTIKYACLTKTKSSDVRQTGSLDTEEASRRLWQQWSNRLLHKIW